MSDERIPIKLVHCARCRGVIWSGRATEHLCSACRKRDEENERAQWLLPLEEWDE